MSDPVTDTLEEAPAVSTRRRRAPWVLAATGIGVIAVIAAVAIIARPAAVDAGEKRDVPVATHTVARGDLVNRSRVSGKLAFDGLRDFGSSLGGTITGLPARGAVVAAGQELFRIDDRPVILFTGTLPMWRSFGEGMEDGPDVKQLEQNLTALGFFDREPDEEFAWSTIAAIQKWQKAVGLDVTGSIELGRIVFSPTDLRVGDVKAKIGDQASAAILSVSGTAKSISVSVDPNLSSVAVAGSAVIVVLPNGAEAPGTILSAGAPVETDDGMGGKKLKLPLIVALDDPALGDGFDNVSVSVVISRTTREDALLVPVLALLAQAGGGFAVEVMDGPKSRMVTVKLGVFADGMVEVTGGKLKVGDKVVVGE